MQVVLVAQGDGAAVLRASERGPRASSEAMRVNIFHRC
ncbi:hypothetical protein BN2537_5455 [Streptomyces venezuelae]|nr:hypothetical protein BN2537_5455 [Streptomyces venezuelae]